MTVSASAYFNTASENEADSRIAQFPEDGPTIVAADMTFITKVDANEAVADQSHHNEDVDL